MRYLAPPATLVLALMASGCGLGLDGSRPAEGQPAVPALISGPVIARPDGAGPPIECRGLARERCIGPGAIEDGVGDVELSTVKRVIVSCVGRCTRDAGEFRIDVVIGSGTREVGRGGYGDPP